MDNRDNLERIIEECFDKMTMEEKIEFLKQVEGMSEENEEENEKEDADDLIPVAIRDRLFCDVASFGETGRIGKELAFFLVSMSRVILEITRELVVKQKTKEEVGIDDLREGLNLDNELSAKVVKETILFLEIIIELELEDEMHLDERWCRPYRLCNLFNLAKKAFRFGDSFLLDTSIFKKDDV